MWKIKKFLIILFSAIIFCGFSFTEGGILDDVYSTSDDYVAKDIQDSEWFAGFLSSVADFMLIVAAVLWVTMVLWGGIMLILALWDESKMQKSKKMLAYIVLGIIIALSSYGIIQIIQSITVWTL